MTIAAAYVTTEGVVLGADSTSTVVTTLGVTQLLVHTQKVFEIGEDTALGCVTWGMGTFGDTSIRAAIHEHHHLAGFHHTMASYVAALQSRLLQHYLRVQSPSDFGMIVAGRMRDHDSTEAFQVLLVPGTPPRPPLPLGLGFYAMGCPDIAARLLRGYDLGLREALVAKKLVSVDDFDREVAAFALVGYPDLPLREAIDFTHFVCYSTARSYKFRYGPPVVGGRIEVAVISADRRFRWVRHKSLASAIEEDT